ncbi:hypothetical protein T08_16753 [Trichinella sp. T8]|nr:hypothetical protein T08_16753 [Trichinella sp. T8]
MRIHKNNNRKITSKFPATVEDKNRCSRTSHKVRQQRGTNTLLNQSASLVTDTSVKDHSLVSKLSAWTTRTIRPKKEKTVLTGTT